MPERRRTTSRGTVVELFAGVGGFRLGLEAAGWEVIWANQWEPSTKTQPAFDCYVSHFTSGIHVNEDIRVVVEEAEAGRRPDIPNHDLLVGGFPCQDYSVAKTLGLARGIEGSKGALWWSIHRLLARKRPRFVFLENVDRLLKSPAGRRGRDFGAILASLSDLGYLVEWRVINAADFGFPQRRRRVFIVGHRINEELPTGWNGAWSWIERRGILARAFPVAQEGRSNTDRELSLRGRKGSIRFSPDNEQKDSPFANSGVMYDRHVWTRDTTSHFEGRLTTLGDILVPAAEVPVEFFVRRAELPNWRELKQGGAKIRVAKNGYEYLYTEGAVPFPDRLDRPSRTVLTAEGGRTPSRFKHVVRQDGRYRRLTPVELERLSGFPAGWTAGMRDGRRAFMMGNAVVVGLIEMVGRELGHLNRRRRPRASAADAPVARPLAQAAV